MDPVTREKLLAINRVFYARSADAFDATRDHAWPGWRRVFEALPEGDSPLRVLDLGCGNARLAHALREALGHVVDTVGRQIVARLAPDQLPPLPEGPPRPIEYTGLDSSAALLARARESLADVPGVVLEEAELLAEPIGSALPSGPFELVALFGVLHHVPDRAWRAGLLEAAYARLAPGGVLAATAWQFAETPRFSGHTIPWSTYNDTAERPVATDTLEPGDQLLRFGEGQGPPRYCHAIDAEALEALVAGLPDDARLEFFRADGREANLNLYVVAKRPDT